MDILNIDTRSINIFQKNCGFQEINEVNVMFYVEIYLTVLKSITNFKKHGLKINIRIHTGMHYISQGTIAV